MKNIPLREKYQNPDFCIRKDSGLGDPPEGTKLWLAQKFKPNPGTAGNGRAGQFGATYKKKAGRSAKKQGYGVRRHSYGPF